MILLKNTTTPKYLIRGLAYFTFICRYKLQFNVIFISDLMFEKISKLKEEEQLDEMTVVVDIF